METITPIGALNRFFRLPGQPLVEFSSELGKLSMDEKMELAGLAAEEMGLHLITGKVA